MPRDIRLPFLVLALILAIPCTAGEIITVPLTLPEIPLYMALPEYVAFDAEQDLPDIIDVRLHVTGNYNTYRNYCWIFGNFGGSGGLCPEDPGLSIGFQEAETTLYLTTYVFERSEEIEAFDLELGFDGGETPDWSFLTGGAGVVYLEGLECEFRAYPVVCSCGPSAEITSAFLVIELESGVPTEKSSWGSIKAIYR